MFQFQSDRLQLELTAQQVRWLRFACQNAIDAAADQGDEQLHAGLVTLAALFDLAGRAGSGLAAFEQRVSEQPASARQGSWVHLRERT